MVQPRPEADKNKVQILDSDAGGGGGGGKGWCHAQHDLGVWITNNGINQKA